MPGFRNLLFVCLKQIIFLDCRWLKKRWFPNYRPLLNFEFIICPFIWPFFRSSREKSLFDVLLLRMVPRLSWRTETSGTSSRTSPTRWLWPRTEEGCFRSSRWRSIDSTNQQHLSTSAPIGAWKCNFPPYRKLWQTDQPEDHPTTNRTTKRTNRNGKRCS